MKSCLIIDKEKKSSNRAMLHFRKKKQLYPDWLHSKVFLLFIFNISTHKENIRPNLNGSNECLIFFLQNPNKSVHNLKMSLHMCVWCCKVGQEKGECEE